MSINPVSFPTDAADPLLLPPGDFKAYLFDLDGTVADTMPLHLISWQAAVREQGGDFPEDLFYALGGVPLPRTVEILNQTFGYSMDPVATAHRKEELYLQQSSHVTAVASVLAHIYRSHGTIPFAIVSGSPHATIIETLKVLGLTDHFPVIVGAEDYTHGKPHPEPFLTAAKLLNVAPADCLVFEDADAGIQSAKAAGMHWVRVPEPRG